MLHIYIFLFCALHKCDNNGAYFFFTKLAFSFVTIYCMHSPNVLNIQALFIPCFVITEITFKKFALIQISNFQFFGWWIYPVSVPLWASRLRDFWYFKHILWLIQNFKKWQNLKQLSSLMGYYNKHKNLVFVDQSCLQKNMHPWNNKLAPPSSYMDLCFCVDSTDFDFVMLGRLVALVYWGLAVLGTKMYWGLAVLATKMYQGLTALGTKMYWGLAALDTKMYRGLAALGTKMYWGLLALGTRRYLGAASPEVLSRNEGCPPLVQKCTQGSQLWGTVL